MAQKEYLSTVVYNPLDLPEDCTQLSFLTRETIFQQDKWGDHVELN